MPRGHYEQRKSPQPRRRLGVEVLEDRTVLSTASPTVSLQGLAVSSSYSSTDVLVQFRAGQTPHAVEGTTLGAAVAGTPGLYDVHLNAGTTVAVALKAFLADPTVLKAEPDYLLGVSSVPNDPMFNQQWDLQNTGQDGGTAGADIKLVAAQSVTQGSPSVIVAVNDTGIDYTHPDLYDNIWINQAEIPKSRLKNLVDYYHDGFISMRDLNDPRNQGVGKITHIDGKPYIDGADLLAPMVKDAHGNDTGLGGWACGSNQDGSGYIDDIIGWNFFANNNNPMDDFGHGTHVAGTIAAMGNNAVGVTGIAPNVQLMPIKFLGAGGTGTIAEFIAGLNFAVSHGARISNNSWSGAVYSTILSDAIANARSHGDIFVAAAGNFSQNNDTQPTYPASFPLDNVVSVAATDRNNQLASFSDYGAHSVQLAAPGVDILSTKPGNTYGLLSGTSQAAPHVAGVLALVWSIHSDWTYSQVINQVLNTVDKIPSLAGKTTTGGIVDAAAAVGYASVASVTPMHIVDSAATGPTAYSRNQITIRFDQSVSPSTLTASAITLTGPSSARIAVTGITAVAGSGDKIFVLSFATQTTAGAYRLLVSSAVKAQSGGSLAPFDSTFYIQTAPATATAPQVVRVTGSGPTASSLNQITVRFDRAVNPSTFTTSSLSFFDQAWHQIAVTGVSAVAGSGNQAFVVTFATRTAAGTYRLHLTSAIRSTSGGSLAPYDGTVTVSSAPVTTATPPHVVSLTGSGPTAYSLSKVTVQFDQAVNPSTFTTSSLSFFDQAWHQIAVTGVSAVAGSGNRSFVVTFATQTAAGTYRLHLTAAIKSASGGSLAPYDGTVTVPSAPVTTPSTTPGTYTSTASVNVPKAGRGVGLISISPNVTIRTIKVKINLTHPDMGDLYIHLQAPDGTDIVLANRKGGSSSNMTGTIFDDNAGTYIGLGRGPFTGSYQPDAQLSSLAGKSTAGAWKLWVEDRIGSSQGTLTSWSLIVN